MSLNDLTKDQSCKTCIYWRDMTLPTEHKHIGCCISGNMTTLEDSWCIGYCWMVDKWGTVSMVPAIIVEEKEDA